MKQMEFKPLRDKEEMVVQSVSETIKAAAICKSDSQARSEEEAYGILARDQTKIAAINKAIKKKLEAVLESLESGVKTPGEIADLFALTGTLAAEAILMAADARLCIDFLTEQERELDFDPESGEIFEDTNNEDEEEKG